MIPDDKSSNSNLDNLINKICINNIANRISNDTSFVRNETNNFIYSNRKNKKNNLSNLDQTNYNHCNIYNINSRINISNNTNRNSHHNLLINDFRTSNNIIFLDYRLFLYYFLQVSILMSK